MKNVWLINHYANITFENEGGRHYWFAEELVKRGYNVTVICSNELHERDHTIDVGQQLYKEVVKKGIRFIFIKTVKSRGNGIKRVLNMTSFYFNLMKVYKKLYTNKTKPNYVIGSSVHPLAMVAGIKISKKLGIPSISEIRDLWPEAIFAFNKSKENSMLGKALIKGEKWIYENSNALIFTKEGDKDYIIERQWDKSHGGTIDLNKCFYINNGINLERFNQSINEYQLDDLELKEERVFKVVYAGALRPVNNVSALVEAAELLKKYENIKIYIYGQGIEEDKLKSLIESKALTNVKLKGFINKKYIPYILSKSSVNILNYSQSEYNWARGNSSNKLFEYMASGKPIISNVKMGYCLLEKYNCGLVTSNNSASALANQILKVYELSNNDYQQLCENAANGAKDFDFCKLTDKLEDVFLYVSK